jgi:hypothetical protein
VGGSGGGPGNVVARGLGPSLGSAGVVNPLQDPQLELYDGDGNLRAQNDNWMDGPRAATIKKDGLAPTEAKEAALLATLQPGAYTAILRGTNKTSGVGVVEVYSVK